MVSLVFEFLHLPAASASCSLNPLAFNHKMAIVLFYVGHAPSKRLTNHTLCKRRTGGGWSSLPETLLPLKAFPC